MIKGLFVWLSPYRLLNVIFDRKPDLFAAYVRITRVSIIARRLLAPEAWKSLGPIRVQTLMFAILRGANGRRHEVDFGDDPVTIDVAMSSTTVQVTMTAADPGGPARCRFVTVALPRDALVVAMAAAAARPMASSELGLRLVDKD